MATAKETVHGPGYYASRQKLLRCEFHYTAPLECSFALLFCLDAKVSLEFERQVSLGFA